MEDHTRLAVLILFLEILNELGLIQWRTSATRVDLPSGRHQAHSDLSRQPMAERLQRALQWNAPVPSSQCRMVLNPETGTARHQQVAQTV